MGIFLYFFALPKHTSDWLSLNQLQSSSWRSLGKTFLHSLSAWNQLSGQILSECHCSHNSDVPSRQTVLGCSEIWRIQHLECLIKKAFRHRETGQLLAPPMFPLKKTNGHRRTSIQSLLRKWQHQPLRKTAFLLKCCEDLLHVSCGGTCQ